MTTLASLKPGQLGDDVVLRPLTPAGRHEDPRGRSGLGEGHAVREARADHGDARDDVDAAQGAETEVRPVAGCCPG